MAGDGGIVGRPCMPGCEPCPVACPVACPVPWPERAAPDGPGCGAPGCCAPCRFGVPCGGVPGRAGVPGCCWPCRSGAPCFGVVPGVCFSCFGAPGCG